MSPLSRYEWIFTMMAKTGKENGNYKDFQLWQQNNHPIELVNSFVIDQKLDYIHENLVKAGIVQKAQHYLYSSAQDYTDKGGLIETDKLY